jgi:shikimate dehydrogenase
MKEYGLIGHPLGHSFSKKFFTDKFCREGIDASYANFDIPDASMLMNIIQEHPNLV